MSNHTTSIYLKPDSHTGIYGIHKYWGKKPQNIVRYFIDKYTSESDIVLDPFCGYGTTAIEALRLGRKAIAIDINPIATFITRTILLPIDLNQLKTYYQYISHETYQLISQLYETRCTKCGNKAIGTHFIWKNDRLQSIWYKCSICKSHKNIKEPDYNDLKLLQYIETQNIPYFYPQNHLYENSRLNVHSNMRVCDLFTKRNLIALSILLNAIEQIPDSSIRDIFKLTFTASLHQASKMVFVIRRTNRKQIPEVGSWVAGYWIPQERFEINVWNCFENRFHKVVKGKRQSMESISSRWSEAYSYDELRESNILISTSSATDLTNLPAESVDYIFTDPPHGDRIPYLELSLLWISWLRMDADFENEVVVSNAKYRKKNIDNYRDMMSKAFAEMYRVLKKGKYLSVAFNHSEEETWQAFSSSLTDLGFKIVNIVPITYSANSVLQDSRKGALKNDFVVTMHR